MKLFHLGLCVNEWPHDGLRRGLVANCTEYRELNCGTEHVNQAVILICREFRPGVVFMQIQSANVISPDTVRIMKELGAMVINWTGDVRDDIPQWMRDLSPYCITAFSNMRDVRNLKGSEYLEIGYDPEIFRPDGHTLPVKPIVFMGNHYGNQFPMSAFRWDMIQYMRQRADFGVYGNIPNGDGSFNHSQLDESAAYRGAKIAINVSHYEIEKYSSDRLIRIMGSGCFCLCKEYPGMPFIDGVHLRTWRNLQELSDLCDYYLDHEDERREIATRGWGYVYNNFTYQNMGANIKEIWEQRR